MRRAAQESSDTKQAVNAAQAQRRAARKRATTNQAGPCNRAIINIQSFVHSLAMREMLAAAKVAAIKIQSTFWRQLTRMKIVVTNKATKIIQSTLKTIKYRSAIWNGDNVFHNNSFVEPTHRSVAHAGDPCLNVKHQRLCRSVWWEGRFK